MATRAQAQPTHCAPQPARSVRFGNIERLVYVPVLGALLVMCSTLVAYSFIERGVVLERIRTQLGVTVAALADFNELAQASAGEAAQRSSEVRSAAIWRALLAYPTASIWVEAGGVVSGGTAPAGDLGKYVLVDDARPNFIVHAALPRVDALADWRRSQWLRGSVLLIVSVGFLALARSLSRALRQRAAAQGEAAAAQERATQLTLHRAELEQTVALRTRELKDSNGLLEKELVERKAAEDALREHDALLNVVTRSAAELLGTPHEDALSTVLDLIGQTVGVSRVQLCQITPDERGHLWSVIRHEWCAPRISPIIDHPRLQNIDLTAALPRTVAPALLSGMASFFIGDVTGTYVGLFEGANMRSFLEIPVQVEGKLWGSLNFIDSETTQRAWSWAETDALKTLAGLIGVAITRARYVQELADANMIVQNSPTILYRLRGEPPFPLIYVSHNITKFGHDPEKLVGAADWMRTLLEPADQEKISEAMGRVLLKGAQAATIEFRMRTGDGGHRWVENRYTPVRQKTAGRLIEVEGIIIDITERKAAEDKIALLARTDALTGLANRVTFIERLRQAFSASRRGASSFAILYIDLDHFKDVNDTLGHPVGDLLLREVAERMKGCTRESDVVARLGGDEFAVLQLDISDAAGAGALVGKLLQSLARPYSLAGHEIDIVTASIGVCPYSSASAGPDAMLAQADLALYRSKEEGRNQYHFHSDDLDLQVQERVKLGEELRKGLERGELLLHYQPQVAVISGQIVGMEALVRWQHPVRGLLEAGMFLPVAEKVGLTVPLGQWVLDQACRQMRQWRNAGIAPPVMAINLSLSQIKSARELVRAVEDATDRWGIQPSDLEFDVTEAILAQATLTQNDVLAQLRGLGARIAIDDFGTEYSSFEYLRTYDVSQLKIAQCYINNAATDPECAATLRAIMNIARELDIGVIAEGVETEQQRALLASCGSASFAQGHYFGEAVNPERAGEMLCTGLMRPLIADEGVTDAAAEALAGRILERGGRAR
jgi:diguanylate cyclase (GGDEF)-like protein/PAS domain S-box-containing protein